MKHGRRTGPAGRCKEEGPYRDGWRYRAVVVALICGVLALGAHGLLQNDIAAMLLLLAGVAMLIWPLGRR